MSYYYISMYSPCPKESSQRISKAPGEVLSESFQGNQCAAAVCVHARVTVCRPTLWGPLSLTRTSVRTVLRAPDPYRADCGACLTHPPLSNHGRQRGRQRPARALGRPAASPPGPPRKAAKLARSPEATKAASQTASKGNP